MVKVMLVDDSTFIRNMLKEIVTKHGDEVIGECENGQVAVEKFPQLKPDLVFMDVMMPEKNGLEAVKEICSAHADAKIVMCTSVGQDKVVNDAVDAGAIDFIVKPFKPEDVISALENHGS